MVDLLCQPSPASVLRALLRGGSGLDPSLSPCWDTCVGDCRATDPGLLQPKLLLDAGPSARWAFSSGRSQLLPLACCSVSGALGLGLWGPRYK